MSENEAGSPIIRPDFGNIRNLHRRNRELTQDTLLKHGINPVGEKRGLISEISKALTKKEAEGDIDTLTGLLNKSGFTKRQNEAISISRRSGTTLFGAVLDADGLKTINDTMGHKAGDAYIAKIGQALKMGTRSGDILGRVGGDEFKLIFINPETEGIHSWWNRQEALLTEQGVRVSAGIAEIDITDVDGSFAKADEAMYAAKLNKADLQNHLFVASNAHNVYNFEEYKSARTTHSA